MAFSAFSGKLGSVKSTSTDVGEITRWTLSANAGSVSFGSSDTALTAGGISYKRTIGGTTVATGSFDVKLNNTASNTDWATYYVPGVTVSALRLYVAELRPGRLIAVGEKSGLGRSACRLGRCCTGTMSSRSTVRQRHQCVVEIGAATTPEVE